MNWNIAPLLLSSIPSLGKINQGRGPGEYGAVEGCVLQGGGGIGVLSPTATGEKNNSNKTMDKSDRSQ